MTKTKQTWLVVGIVLLALVLDQISKVYIKTHFELGETHVVLDSVCGEQWHGIRHRVV